MGGFSSKKNRVQPVTSNLDVRLERKSAPTKRFCCCCFGGNKVLPISSSTYNVVAATDGLPGGDGPSRDINDGSDVVGIVESSSSTDPVVFNPQLGERAIAFPGDKTPLPKIAAKGNEATMPQALKREMKNGNIKAVSFAIDLDGLPLLDSATRKAKLKPMRLRRLPEIEKRVNVSSFSEAKDGRNSCQLSKTGASKVLSKEMLEKLEAEKQREIDLRCKEKQIQAEIRRQLLMDEREEKLRNAEKKRLKVKDNITAQAKQISATTQNKMKRAEQRKAALKLKTEEKKELAQKRHEDVKKNIEIKEKQISSSAEENLAHKMKRVEQRKAAMRMKTEEKKELAQKRQENVKKNIESKEKQISLSADENLTNKMKRVEERKAELRQKAEEKKEMARMRRLRASLNSRLAKIEESATNSEGNNRSIDDSQRELDGEDELHEDPIYEIETAPSDEDPELYNFNDGNITEPDEDDSFWETA